MFKEFTSNKNGFRIAFDIDRNIVIYEQILETATNVGKSPYTALTSVTIQGLVYEVKEPYETVLDRLNHG